MTTTLEYALHLQDASDTHRVVLVIDVSHGADALVARPELETLAALRGRRVGVESGELGRYVLTRALDHAGLAASAIEIVPIDHADQEEAFRAGRVDAVVTYDPIRTRLLADGARALFDSRSIPGEIVDVLVVRQSLVESRRTELRGLVRGWFAAARDFAADPSGSAAIMARREGLGVEELLTALEGVHLPDAAETEALLAGRDPRLVDSIRRRAESLAAAGVVDRLPDLETLFDASIVVEARE
jgi:NitT/TauT family transport system substrate-binding protein